MNHWALLASLSMLGVPWGTSYAQPGRVGQIPAGSSVAEKDSNPQDLRNKRGADLRLALTPSKGQAGNTGGNSTNVAGAHNGKFRQEIEPDAKSGLMNAADNSANQPGSGAGAGSGSQPKTAAQPEPKTERHLSAREREEMREQLRQQRAKR